MDASYTGKKYQQVPLNFDGGAFSEFIAKGFIWEAKKQFIINLIFLTALVDFPLTFAHG